MRRSKGFAGFQLHVLWLTIASLSTAVNTQSDFRNKNILEKYIIVKSDAYNALISVRNNSILQGPRDAWYIRELESPGMVPAWKELSFKEEEDGAYSIQKLSANTSYKIRNLSPAGYFIPELNIQTCPETPPKVTTLRLKEAGLGWLDIRWKQPKELCPSVINYKVSYSFNTTKTGYIKKTILFYVLKTEFFYVTHVKVTHPCDTWPEEFCILLTENIYPGINYEVQVQTGRYSFSSNTNQISESVSIFVTTNVSNFGPADAVQCPTNEKKPRRLFHENTDCTSTDTSLHTWIIIIIAVLIAINIGIIIAFLIRRYMKKAKTASKRSHTPNLAYNSGLSNLSALYDYPKT